MKGKKIKILILSTLFVALSVAVVLFFVLVVSFSNRKQSIVDEEFRVKPRSYQYLHYDPKSGESTVGMTKSMKEIEEDDSVFYQDVKGNFVLISNLGSEEYFCSGTCSCVNDDENERRVVKSGTVAVRGVIYLVAAVTSYVAVHKAKDYYEEECVNQLSETCLSPTSTIISEVETCEKGTDPSMSMARFGSLGDAFRADEDTLKKFKDMKDKAYEERKKQWEEREKERKRNPSPPKRYNKKPQRPRPQQGARPQQGGRPQQGARPQQRPQQRKGQYVKPQQRNDQSRYRKPGQKVQGQDRSRYRKPGQRVQGKDQSRYRKPEQRVQGKVQEKSQERTQPEVQKQVETKVSEESKPQAKVSESQPEVQKQAETKVETVVKEETKPEPKVSEP